MLISPRKDGIPNRVRGDVLFIWYGGMCVPGVTFSTKLLGKGQLLMQPAGDKDISPISVRP